jgi:hypothetical protein
MTADALPAGATHFMKRTQFTTELDRARSERAVIDRPAFGVPERGKPLRPNSLDWQSGPGAATGHNSKCGQSPQQQ